MKKIMKPNPVIITLLCFLITLTTANSQNFIWAKQMGGIDTDEGRAICIDIIGNIYITGWFNGTADFDPGTGTYNLTSSGTSDIYVAKLDAAGNFNWAINLGGSGIDAARDIAVDPAGNIYITGNFEDTADFDPGIGIYNLTCVGGSDIFVCKLSSSGSLIWAKQMGGPSGNAEVGYSIAVDVNGNVYTLGVFFSGDFDPGPGIYNLTSAGYHDVFISKLGDYIPLTANITKSRGLF